MRQQALVYYRVVAHRERTEKRCRKTSRSFNEGSPPKNNRRGLSNGGKRWTVERKVVGKGLIFSDFFRARAAHSTLHPYFFKLTGEGCHLRAATAATDCWRLHLRPTRGYRRRLIFVVLPPSCMLSAFCEVPCSKLQASNPTASLREKNRAGTLNT